jgi:hypothetical protein
MSSPESVSADNCECHRCHAGLLPEQLRCPVCGMPRPGVDLPLIVPAAAATDTSSSRGMIDNPRAVLAAVFLAMMFLGIPLIWACRAWSPGTKVVLTIVTLLYSALIFWLFWLAMSWSWSRINPHL